MRRVKVATVGGSLSQHVLVDVPGDGTAAAGLGGGYEWHCANSTPDEGRNQRPSEAIRGHQRSSEAIRGHQWPSEANSAHRIQHHVPRHRNQMRSEAIDETHIGSSTTSPGATPASRSIRYAVDERSRAVQSAKGSKGRGSGAMLHFMDLPDEGDHQRSSEVIRGHQHQRSSEVIRCH